MRKLFKQHTATWKLGWRVLALLLAFNYFSFRVELFKDEDEQNHPVVDPCTHQTSISPSTLNWETFDKDNAPKAITIHPDVPIELFLVVHCPPQVFQHFFQPYQPVRDKSPPPGLFS